MDKHQIQITNFTESLINIKLFHQVFHSNMSHEEKAALKLLGNVRQSSLLKPLADSTTHVLDSYPRRHHPSLGGNSHAAPCAYTDLFQALYSDVNVSRLTDSVLTVQVLKHKEGKRVRLTDYKVGNRPREPMILKPTQ